MVENKEYKSSSMIDLGNRTLNAMKLHDTKLKSITFKEPRTKVTNPSPI